MKEDLRMESKCYKRYKKLYFYIILIVTCLENDRIKEQYKKVFCRFYPKDVWVKSFGSRICLRIVESNQKNISDKRHQRKIQIRILDSISFDFYSYLV